MIVWKQDPSLSDRFNVNIRRGDDEQQKGKRAFSEIMKRDPALNRKRNAIDRLMRGTKRYEWRKDLIMRPPTRHHMLDAKIKEFHRKAQHSRFETNFYRKYGFSTNPAHLYPKRTHQALLRESKDLNAEMSNELYDGIEYRDDDVEKRLGWRRLDRHLDVTRKWMARYRLLDYCDVRDRGTHACSAHELTKRIVSRRVSDEKK